MSGEGSRTLLVLRVTESGVLEVPRGQAALARKISLNGSSRRSSKSDRSGFRPLRKPKEQFWPIGVHIRPARHECRSTLRLLSASSTKGFEKATGLKTIFRFGRCGSGRSKRAGNRLFACTASESDEKNRIHAKILKNIVSQTTCDTASLG